ncbi:MAG: hypothetical protein A2096_15620 [Spirochaetes bacterium GWF1_41_5]|nr:MAG: hypothetical protein A2096_15620 [Spirochaetes bacterium GWF1_41_5]
MNIIKIFNLAVVILSVFLFITCSYQKKINKIKICIASSYSSTSAGTQIIKRSLERYEKKHPEIKIEYRWISRDYKNKLLTMIASGDAPDIFRMAPDDVPQFIVKNTIMSLDEFVKKSSVFNIDDFFETTLWKYKFDGEAIGKGRIYGFGSDWSPAQNLFYNKELFINAGLEIPEKSLSWTEFIVIEKNLPKETGIINVLARCLLIFTLWCIRMEAEFFQKTVKTVC